MRTTILTVVICVGGLLWTARAAVAQEPDAGSEQSLSPEAATAEARMHFDVARRFYDRGHFDEAAREFEAAYAISHLVSLQFNLYLAYRDSGDDAQAAAALRRYVESLEEGSRRAQLTARLRILDARLQQAGSQRAEQDDDATAQRDESRQDAPRHEQDEQDESTAVSPARREPAPEPSSRLAPWIVVGAGGALLLGAAVTGIMANSEQSTLDDLCPTRDTCTGDFEASRSRGKRLALTTDILWMAGAAAAGTGLIWAMLTKDPQEDSPPRATLSCGMSGCMASLHGAF